MLPRGTCPMWTGWLLLLGFIYCVCFVEGQKLAVQKCNEYRELTTTKQNIDRLGMDTLPVEIKTENCTSHGQLIAGGEQAKYGEFPHHALLGYPIKKRKGNYEFLCGGTLISEQHVLTAAHCYTVADPTIVRLGEHDTTNATDLEYNVQIAAFRKHPEYKNFKPYHDIAVVKLANRIYFTKWIRPACLWDTEYRNVTGYIAAGFGHTQFGGPFSTVMMKVPLSEFPVHDCAREYKIHWRFGDGIKDGQLCIGSSFEGRDTCQGDSGGPLLTLTNPNSCIYQVVAITSTGIACGTGKVRAINTKVSHYIDWIEDNVWGANAL